MLLRRTIHPHMAPLGPFGQIFPSGFSIAVIDGAKNAPIGTEGESTLPVTVNNAVRPSHHLLLVHV